MITQKAHELEKKYYVSILHFFPINCYYAEAPSCLIKAMTYLSYGWIGIRKYQDCWLNREIETYPTSGSGKLLPYCG